ncbi:MAG: hypothetical protein IKN22_02405 [Bacteroidaceae bacterium]|nr:hypothetical protein [Bacteroidaceae bacterium]
MEKKNKGVSIKNQTRRGARILLILLALTLSGQWGAFCVTASAQSSGTNSPYSRYGWGVLNDEAMGFNKGMAGVALGMRDPNIINRQNPASYSEMDSLRFLFDIGVSLQNCWMREGDIKKNVHNSTLDYAVAAFRFGKGLGFSLGLRPFSTIGYNFSSTTEMPDVDGLGVKTSTSTYSGDGGLHEIYGGIGWQPLKPVSIGTNIKYVWGDYNHYSAVSYSDASVQTLTRKYTGRLNAVSFDFGLQVQHNFSKKDRVVLGLTYSPGQRISQKATFINQQTNNLTGSSADTTNIGNAYELPTNLGVGLSWCHDYQWTVGLDYTLQAWEKCRFPALRERGGNTVFSRSWKAFQNRHRLAAGVEFVPNPRGMRVRDHICYRAGLAYSTPYAKVNGDNGPKSFMVSAGAAIPIVNRYTSHSVLNISAQWEHMQASSTGKLKEDYLRLCLGLTFSARWFEKWKVK